MATRFSAPFISGRAPRRVSGACDMARLRSQHDFGALDKFLQSPSLLCLLLVRFQPDACFRGVAIEIALQIYKSEPTSALSMNTSSRAFYKTTTRRCVAAHLSGAQGQDFPLLFQSEELRRAGNRNGHSIVASHHREFLADRCPRSTRSERGRGQQVDQRRGSRPGENQVAA